MALTDFPTWCEHYGYDPDSPEASRDYLEAQKNLLVLKGVRGRKYRKGLKEAVKRAQTRVANPTDEYPGSRFTVFYRKVGERERRTPWFTRRSHAHKALAAMKGRGFDATIFVD